MRLSSVRRALLAFGAVCALAGMWIGAGGSSAAVAARAAPTVLTVRVDRPGAIVDRALVGFDFHFGARPPSAIASLRPRFVRLDASLEQVSPAPAVVHLNPLQERVAAVRKIGAEPLVILAYTPAWLGQPLAPLPDRTRTEPNDLNAWRTLVKRVVVALASGPGRVRWFEAWNEPDLPTFWDGTQTAWLDTAAASAEAVHAAAVQTRLPLAFGGPASFRPDPPQVSAFVERLRSEGLPPAFISWHYYANYPCLGPDGPENPSDPTSVALQKALGCVNPAASPLTYAPGTALVRTAIASGSGGAPSPLLILDEWNLSAGGLDLRMNTNVGAAFDVGTLITLQQDRVGAAAFYEATDTDPRPGGWGTVAVDGTRRPSWYAFRFWQELGPRTVAVTGTDPVGGLWAIASSSDNRRRVTVLLASFSVAQPAARVIVLHLEGLAGAPRRMRAVVQRIDSAHRGDEPPASGHLTRSATVTLALPDQAVALVTITAPRGRRITPVTPPSAPRGAQSPRSPGQPAHAWQNLGLHFQLVGSANPHRWSGP